MDVERILAATEEFITPFAVVDEEESHEGNPGWGPDGCYLPMHERKVQAQAGGQPIREGNEREPHEFPG